MARTVNITVKQNDRRKKLSGLQVGLDNIPKVAVKTYFKTILPKMKKEMQDIIKGWPDAVTSTDGVGADSNFVISKSSKGAKLSNVKPYSEILVSGTSKHGPVYIGDWAERGNITALQRPDGSFSKFTEVGGNNSRIKLNNSERDFWNPVLEKYIGTTGLGTSYVASAIEREIRKRVI